MSKPIIFMTLQDAEALLNKAISENCIDPEHLMIALHNACTHGSSLEEAGYNVNEKDLGELFDGFDKSIAALRSMKG